MPRLSHMVTALASSGDGRCLLCDKPFQARRTGGTPKKFCSPAHRNVFHTVARKWAEKAVAGGHITLDDPKRDPAACTLILTAFSVSPVPQAPRQLPVPEAPPDEAALLSDELYALLGDILDRLSPEELGWLPDPVWALLDFIARPDATEEAL